MKRVDFSNGFSAIYISPNPEPNQLLIWSIADRTLVESIDGINNYSWGAENVIAFSVEGGASVFLLNNLGDSRSVELFTFEQEVSSLVWDSSGVYLVGTSIAGELIVWDSVREEVVLSLDNVATNIRSLKWHDMEAIVSIATTEGALLLCLPSSTITIVTEIESYDTAWHFEQSLLAVAQDDNLVIFDVSQFVESCGND